MAKTWESDPGSPTMLAIIAGPIITPAVGPWIPTDIARVLRYFKVPNERESLPDLACSSSKTLDPKSSELNLDCATFSLSWFWIA